METNTFLFKALGGNSWNYFETFHLDQENDTSWKDTETDFKNNSEMLFLETVMNRVDIMNLRHILGVLLLMGRET